MTKPRRQPGNRSSGYRTTLGYPLTSEVTEVTDFGSQQPGARRTAEAAELVTQLLRMLAVEPASPPPTSPENTLPQRVLLTVGEAAERLGIGKTKTCSLIRSGELESVLIGRSRRIHVDSIAAYAAQLVAAQTGTRHASRRES